MHEKGIPLQYTIIANGEAEAIKFQIKDQGLSDIVHILPGLPQENVFEHMAAADILLLPSLEEGIANVALEAMAIGLPVVSSDCGGMPEVIKDGETGFLYHRWDIYEATQKILECIDCKAEMRQVIATKARLHIERHHTLSHLQEGFSSLYENE